MTYSEMLFVSNIISNIPVGKEGYTFPDDLSASVFMLQAAYAKQEASMQDFMKDVFDKMKKEGFDDRNKDIQEMKETDEKMEKYNEWLNGDRAEKEPEKPTDEQLEKAEKTRGTKEDFDEEYKELEKLYSEAYGKKMKEEAPKFTSYISRADYEKIVKALGTFGDIEIEKANKEKQTIGKIDFLRIIAMYAVQ